MNNSCKTGTTVSNGLPGAKNEAAVEFLKDYFTTLEIGFNFLEATADLTDLNNPLQYVLNTQFQWNLALEATKYFDVYLKQFTVVSETGYLTTSESEVSSITLDKIIHEEA